MIGLSITAFVLFTTTKDLEPIAGFNPWAEPTTLWPQILILIVACISFIASAIVIVGYLRHGHRGAESISYVTTIAMVFGWAVWLAIWIAAGASLQRVRATGNRRDLWGWACAKHTPRYQVFHSKVDYDLMCRIQEWNFICSMINIGAWVASVSVMLFTAYRLWVRNKMGPQTEKQGVSVDA